MPGVQYSLYKMEVTFTLCKGPYTKKKKRKNLCSHEVHLVLQCSLTKCECYSYPMCNIPKNLFKWTGKMIKLTARLLTYDRSFPPFFSPLYLIYMQILNCKYTFLMINMLIIIIRLLAYNFFLLFTRFHSSPVEHENLRSNG